MKKLLIIFVIVLNVFALAVHNVNADFFDEESSLGQDLYISIYQRLRDEPTEVAVKHTLTGRPLSKEELMIVMGGKNISAALTQPLGTAKLTPQQAQANLEAIKADYNENLELAEFETSAAMAVAPTELFANGDESDSGFDLISDLALIDMILFQSTVETEGAGGAGGPSGVNQMKIGVAGGGPATTSAGQGSSASQKAVQFITTTTSTSQTGVARSNAGGGLASAATNSSAQAQDGRGAAALCPVNTAFNSAVATARAGEQANTGRGAENNTSTNGAGTLGGPISISGESSNNNNNATGIRNTNTPASTLTPEPPGDWSRPLPCNSHFCLTFEAIYKKASLRQKTDNCIACHFEKINDAFKQTLGHNLTPSKVTGNIFEAPKCKKSALPLKWSVILVPQPIVTPPNDDLVIKGDLLKSTISFYQKYYDNPGRCDDPSTGGGACKPDQSPEANATEAALKQITPATTQRQILDTIAANVAVQREKKVRELTQMQLTSEATNQIDQFRVLLQEFDAMNSYFASFQKIYRDLVADGPESPCTIFINKSVCE